MVIVKTRRWFIERSAVDEHGCWIWCGAINQCGYGTWHGGLVHRGAWIAFNSSIPDEMCVLHRCDVPRCINPDHLFIGTQLDNIKDRDAKGRGNKGQSWKQDNPRPRATHCFRDHALTSDNRDKFGGCKRCHAIRERERYRSKIGIGMWQNSKVIT